MIDQARPVFVVIGGPNGAGKSTITPRVLVGEKLDPDAIAKRINPSDPGAAALPAAREAIKSLKQWKQDGRSFTYETTLSSNASLKEIEDAKAKNYEVRLYFVALDTPAQSADRVSTRVESGGHNIPTADIFRRFELTFANAIEAAPRVDRFELIDNHKGDFVSVLLIENQRITMRGTSDSPRIQIAITALAATAAASLKPLASPTGRCPQ
jgi:predicted ABC-type ATPase